MPYFHAVHYKVTTDAITPTGTREFYMADDRNQAVEKCLYTHRLHNRNAYSFSGNGMPPHYVVMCQSCGQIAITPEPRLVQSIREDVQPAAPAKWYTSGTAYNAHDQGLVIEEKTGKTIAVTYKQENARLIAATPELLDALEKAKDCFTGHNLLSTASEEERNQTIKNFLQWWNYEAIPAIQKASG